MFIKAYNHVILVRLPFEILLPKLSRIRFHVLVGFFTNVQYFGHQWGAGVDEYIAILIFCEKGDCIHNSTWMWEDLLIEDLQEGSSLTEDPQNEWIKDPLLEVLSAVNFFLYVHSKTRRVSIGTCTLHWLSFLASCANLSELGLA